MADLEDTQAFSLKSGATHSGSASKRETARSGEPGRAVSRRRQRL